MSMILAACGGGGGGSSSNSSSPTSLPSDTTTNTTASAPSTSPASASGDMAQKANMANGALSGSDTTSITSDASANTVTVDGHTVDVVKNTGISSRGQHSISGTNGEQGAAGNTLAYATWGYFKTTDGSYYNFVTGTATPVADMPTTGMATYTGYGAITSGPGSASLASANSSFDVNFADKTIVGSVSSSLNNVPISATITGNTFAGDVAGVKTVGGFYGAGAANLAGGFVDSKQNLIGAFGAAK